MAERTNCASGKIRYRDKLGAQIALASTFTKGKAKREETRVYRCPKCKGWHLTSEPPRKPSIKRGNAIQGSADPGRPTHLMQPQTLPITDHVDRCSMCGDLGWTLDARLTDPPIQVELIPCCLPDCEMSGRTIQSVCFKDVEFTEIARRPDGVVMKVGRPL